MPRARGSCWPGTASRGDAPARYARTFGDIPGLRRVRPKPSCGTARGSPDRRARGFLARRSSTSSTAGQRRDKTVAMTSTGSPFKRWVFSRHSHPWSAWTRWASTPLVLLPVWNRSARQGVVVAAWFALNPVLFPPPRDDSAFATRAVLGEERWLEERQRTSSSSLADDHRNDRHDERVALVLAGDGSLLRHAG
jgi:hypothetical protein